MLKLNMTDLRANFKRKYGNALCRMCIPQDNSFLQFNYFSHDANVL